MSSDDLESSVTLFRLILPSHGESAEGGRVAGIIVSPSSFHLAGEVLGFLQALEARSIQPIHQACTIMERRRGSREVFTGVQRDLFVLVEGRHRENCKKNEVV